MAFKFKVKKRPNMGQAVASAFAAGVSQGASTALQDAMKQAEEDKKKQKLLNKELKSKTDEIGQLANLVDDTEMASNLRQLQVRGLKYPSVEALDDAVINTGVFNDVTLRNIGKDNFGAMIPDERYPVKKFEIGETRERKVDDKIITESYSIDESTRKPSWKEVSTAPRVVTQEKKYEAYNKTTGEVIRATESEVENDPNIAFGTPKRPATKKVLNKTTNEDEFATEEQIANAKGNLVPTKNQPAFLTLFDESPDIISPQVPSPKEVMLQDITSGKVTVQVGEVINDPLFGKLRYKGGDIVDFKNSWDVVK